jgi:hypothetical protein
MAETSLASSQALARIGSPLDLYYTDADNAKVQAIPVEYNTRFSQDFNNKSTGVSVFQIPPGNGLRHVVIVLGYNASTINTQTGSRALARGWGYQALSQVSFRIGGSSQFFLSAQQLLARNLRLCRTQSQRDAILSLGGNECKVATDFDKTQYAYIPVSVWAAPADDGICLPLPADLLSQPTQITAEIAPTSAFWTAPIAGFGGGDVAPPTAFDIATFQVEQFVMVDRAMSLANRVDLSTHSYGMPLPSFDQQIFTQPLALNVSQPVVLSGFRAGEVTKLQIWLTKTTTSSAQTATATLNRALWYAPAEVTCLYAGVIFAQYLNGVSKMFNLLDGTAPAAVNHSELAVSGGAYVSTGVLSEWAELPFAMPSGTDYEADVLRHGKAIVNGIVNLQITPPALDVLDTTTTGWQLNVSYVYNATASFSKGSCDIVF